MLRVAILHAHSKNEFSTQADDIDSLKEMLRNAVRCHFPDEQTRPKIICLHIVCDEVIASSNSRDTCLVMN